MTVQIKRQRRWLQSHWLVHDDGRYERTFKSLEPALQYVVQLLGQRRVILGDKIISVRGGQRS